MNSTLINLNNKEFDLNNVCKVSFDLNLLKNFLFNLLEENFNKYQNFFQILNKSEKQNIQILKNQEEINKKLNVFESIINEKDENKENNIENNPKFISLLNRIKQLETKFDLNYENSNNEKLNFIEKNINDIKYKINELNTKFKQLKNEFNENKNFSKIATLISFFSPFEFELEDLLVKILVKS
jgi:phage shock protein A